MNAGARTRPLPIAALMAALLVAGCHRRGEESAPANRSESPEATVTTNDTTPPPEVREPPTTETNMSAMAAPAPVTKPPKAWPAPAIPPDEQTQDDADATGMTAHVAPDAGGADAGGNAR